MIQDSDLKTVHKAKKGNKKAFGELVNKYYDMVFGISYGVMRNREQAKDVAQDVFLKVYRDLYKFEEKSKFKTWLYRVTVNAALDQVRKRKPTRSLDMTDASTEDDTKPMVLEDGAAGPRDRASQEELKVLVKRTLDDLSEEHRSVLVLREWQGLSYEEISETLEIEIGTVMSRIFYARKKLAEVIKAKGILDLPKH